MDVHIHIAIDDRILSVGRRLLAPAAAVALIAPLALWATPINLPHTFTDGTTAESAQVNANFSTLETKVNEIDAFFEPGAGGSHDVVLGAGADERVSAAEAATLTAGAGSNADALHSHAAAARAWTNVGTLADYDTLIVDYPTNNYEWAVTYNATINPVTINGWNRGLRISGKHLYPQGDNATGLSWGTTVFTRGILPENNGSWYQRYYAQNADGKLVQTGGNGLADSVTVHVRLL